MNLCTQSKLFGSIRSLTSKTFLPVLTILTLLSPRPSQAFNLISSEGSIEFSANNLEAPSATPIFGNMLPNELRSPGGNYPVLADPQPPSQTKFGSLPLSDTWNDPLNRGTGNINISTIAQPTLAAVTWNWTSPGLKDGVDGLVNDNLASRNASFGKASFQTTISGLYDRFAYLNVGGSIDLSKPDAWVVGSLVGKIEEEAFEPIIFAFDGAGRGRQDFIQAGNGGFLSAGTDTFVTTGMSFLPPIFLNAGADALIEGTFTCAAYNGRCESVDIQYFSQPVPEPLTILGSVAALGIGTMLKKQRSKSLQKAKSLV
jgi:hypothetical protein